MRYGQGSGRAASYYSERRKKKRITLMGVLMVVDALALGGILLCYLWLFRFLNF